MDDIFEPNGISSTKITARKLLGCFSVVVLLFLGAVWLRWAVREAHEAASQSACQSKLNQLQLAFRNYHETYGSFPPAYTVNTQGEKMHSWRVLILPFIDQLDVYDRYQFDQPWNSPDNLKLENEIYTDMFHCPSGPHRGDSPITDYVLVTGGKTAFPGSKSTRIEDFADGVENTILLVEIANSGIHWMEPRDLEFDTMSFKVNDASRPSISGPHPRGPAVVFGDRIRAYRLDQSLEPELIKGMLTIDGGEDAIDKESLRSPQHY